MLSLAILLTILTTPVLVGLSAFFRLQPSENRIGITSYVEVLRLRAKAPAVCANGDFDSDESDDSGYFSSDFAVRGQSASSAENPRLSAVTLAK